jgi:DNA-binding FadR family transcriptional regulator
MASDEVAKRIIQHLKEHPRACDTLEGVVQWWMKFQQLEVSIAEVREALGRLKAEGVVEERVGSDNRTVYFARQRGDDDAE